jgi:hypothetical protein
MLSKFDLRLFDNPGEPVVMYGLYKQDDYDFLQNYGNRVHVLWCGSDARIAIGARVDIIKSSGCVNIAKNRQIHDTLKSKGIDSRIIPVTPTPMDIGPEKKGKKVYCYIGNPGKERQYKVNALRQIESRVPYKFVYAYHNSYPREQLLDIYRQCFIGIRLLDHDGLSNSIIEMALMGRRTISNNPIPGTLPWRKGRAIPAMINREYKRKDIERVHKEMIRHIDIGDKWLYYDDENSQQVGNALRSDKKNQ